SPRPPPHRPNLRHRRLRQADGRLDRSARLRAAPGRRACRRPPVRRRQPARGRRLLADQPPNPGVGDGTHVSYAEAAPLSARARRRRILRRRFLRRPAAVISLVVVVGAVLMALFARWIAPYSPDATDLDALPAGPSPQTLAGAYT